MNRQCTPENPPNPVRSGKSDPGARKRLEQLREDIDYLFHEIRTPLTAVINYAEFLEENVIPHAEMVPFLQIICREGQRICNLLDDFTRIYHGEASDWLTEIDFAEVAVDALLLDAAERFRNASPLHSIRVELPPGLPPVQGDREKLNLVLRNLLANAIKYSPRGGTIELAAEASDAAVTIRVSDQGIGIPAECLASVFNREFRSGQPECRHLRGSGLGLTLVQRIVEVHGGRVCVESRAGQGSSFFVSLPSINPDR